MINAILVTGDRPPMEPERSPLGSSYELLWNVVERCWDVNPDERPSMKQVAVDVAKLTGNLSDDRE